MSEFQITRLATSDPDFDQNLGNLLAYDESDDTVVHQRVSEIIAAIRKLGDRALVDYTQQLDQYDVTAAPQLELPKELLKSAWNNLSKQWANALEVAAKRIKAYAEHQKMESWQYREADGTVLGQQVSPLERVGLYVPGGKAAYPSSVLMNAIPAKVAGVKEMVMVVPTPGGDRNELVLAAAYLAGVDRVFTVGGAQAIAALAYGTETIPKVEKIVGPGNIYVATAKKIVFGQVGIDMIAGPSEILVICDGHTHVDWICADLFSQAEHDEDAQAILLSPDAAFLDQVESAMAAMLPSMERARVIRASLASRGALVLVKNLDQAVDVANRIAPEHLELSVENPEALVGKIRNAGAIFMGRYTAEALGDYCAGPNHVLPTSGTARFASPLGVDERRFSVISEP